MRRRQFVERHRGVKIYREWTETQTLDEGLQVSDECYRADRQDGFGSPTLGEARAYVENHLL